MQNLINIRILFIDTKMNNNMKYFSVVILNTDENNNCLLSINLIVFKKKYMQVCHFLGNSKNKVN